MIFVGKTWTGVGQMVLIVQEVLSILYGNLRNKMDKDFWDKQFFNALSISHFWIIEMKIFHYVAFIFIFIKFLHLHTAQ